MKKERNKNLRLVSSIILILIATTVIIYLTLSDDNFNPESSLASCLTKNGAIFYGSDNCGYCLRQKALFEESFKDIVYVNCQTEKEKCSSAKITAYPTWIINGNKLVGLQSLEKLANATGCKI
jgi:glutaredoxin